MDTGFLDAVTKMLNEFTLNKPSQVMELVGPVKQGLSYRWRLMSNRYREVTVLLVTKKPFMGKPAPERFEVYGLGSTQALGPTLEELQTFLGKSELALAG